MEIVSPPAVSQRERDPSGAPPDPMGGRVFGERYRVVGNLGEGGMGTVYLCEHAVLGRRFAVKVLRPERAADPELKERFRAEAITASRIGQENVVEVLDYGEEADGALFYVMEALEGRSLGAILREDGPLPVGRGLAILEQVCRALAAAHARGVIHRDVKPENVFVVRGADGAERAKVIDFGISSTGSFTGRDRITREGSIIGTPEYMAPEQAVGSRIDHRADVYAVGVLAYELLTGALPLVGETPMATLVAHQTRIPEAPGRRQPGIPPEVDALVLRALAKRPADRFESMLAFAGEVARIRLASCMAGSPAVRTARYDSPPRPSGRGGTVALPESRPGLRAAARPARRRMLAAVGAAVALTLALAAGRYWGAHPVGPPSAAAAEVEPPPPLPSAAAPVPVPEPPVLVVEPPSPTAAPEPASRPRPARTALRPRGPSAAGAEPGRDPYADEDLKPDPFR